MDRYLNVQETDVNQLIKDKRYDEISAYIAHETSAEAVLEGHDGFGLVQFTIQDARDAAVEFSVAISICRSASRSG